MPIYEYQCECGVEKELLLSFKESSAQVCACGKHLQRKLSAPNFVTKQTAKGMALDTLNSKQNGMPDRHWKSYAEQKAFEGV
ncbi:hypothetical protein LCGC14_2356850 [marine sediment metagenome]|uniref:Putative regulatory protein FmdB zinc ribbon domain-containing protein n=1 Tax=marine sediment metagenome TaxID=412755 RepID=A0A0F9C7I1_9ZZZZ